MSALFEIIVTMRNHTTGQTYGVTHSGASTGTGGVLTAEDLRNATMQAGNSLVEKCQKRGTVA